MKQENTVAEPTNKNESLSNKINSDYMSPKSSLDEKEFMLAQRQVVRYQPISIKAPNHNDVMAFVHSWFAGFDHIEAADFFLKHFDNNDMTFNMDGQVLASDHASFRTWFADALTHIPWDFHEVIAPQITGTYQTGWSAEFYIRHVGVWHEIPIDDPNTGSGQPFNRIIRVNWTLEHNGKTFLIRRYELSMAQNILSQ